MSGIVADPRLMAPRAAPRRAMRLNWTDPKFRAIVWQVVVVGFVVAIIGYLVRNTSQNLAARHIATGFGFLEAVAPIPIGEHLIDYTPSVSSYGRAMVVGILNTVKVAVVGVILATILGTAIGIARLSKNWLVAKLAAVYVEVIRDIPVLLQLVFWYGLIQTLPPLATAFNPVAGVYLSKAGLRTPALDWQLAHGWALAAFLLGLIGTIAWSGVAAKRQAETGVRPRVWPVAVGLLVVFPLLVWAALGAPFHLDMPIKTRFSFNGGMTVLSPEYTVLVLGLVIYTASYIAEIVRSGIQAVPQGQWEAAGALGLRPGAVLRRVVLPQALRVVIPPMTSQYLNLTKNSSLAVAVGYADVVGIDVTMLNQTGQSVEGIALVMVVFLTISLSISLFMNWYNARIALVER